MSANKLLVKGSSPAPLDRELTVVGIPLNRKDGIEKVTGQAKYSSDLQMPGMLYGKVLHCPYPRARIVKIDVRRAEALPGVQAILTKDNTKGWLTYWYEVPQRALPGCLTYEGQEVAVLAAEDIDTAQRALDLIEIEYEPLEPMMDMEEVLRHPPPPCVAEEEYPGRDLFDRRPFVLSRGDVEKGFSEANFVLEQTYTTPTQYHAAIQTRACVANWDGQILTVWDSTQGVWNSKGALARSLGLDPDCVRVIVEHLGGGFGSKAWAHRISFFAAKLSMITKRPVKMEQSRGEEFLIHPHRYNLKITFRMGAKKDGTLTAIYERAVLNIGAAASRFNYNSKGIIWQTSNLYACPNVHLEQIGVFTNLQLTGPTRSPFNMPAIFPLESHIDMMAEGLGLDPLEFRMKNYSTYASTHVKPELSEREMKISFSSKKLDVCMKKVTEAIGWERRKTSKRPSKGFKRRGMGMAAFIAHQGGGIYPNTAHADLSIHKDGCIKLYIGVVDIGGGQKTILSMIAAEELGVTLEDITIVSGDTKGTRYAPSCHSSRCTAEMGPPVLQAAAQAKQKLFELVAPIFHRRPEELESKNGEVYVRSTPSVSIPIKALCSNIDPEEPLWGSGSREINPDDPIFSSFGAQAVELEVDVETGDVMILRMTAAQDFGKAVNPKLCLSQIIGGIEFGVGYALTEQGIYDSKTAKMLNPNLHQYRLPTSADMPRIDAFLIESQDPHFAFSARGGGEVTNTPTPAAIRNAVYNAVGIWMNELPMTPEKILAALRARQEKR